jgi:hypothetical protein
MSRPADATTTTTATAAQVLTGLQVADAAHRARCTACGAALYEGSPVRVYAYQLADEDTVTPSRLYCRGCKDDITPTLGATEVLADATLGLQAHPHSQTHALALTDVRPVVESPPEEGQ